MTLITDALTRAARQCSIGAPSSWLTATDTEHEEIRDDFLSETVDDLLQRADFPSPISKQVTLATDGSESYDLPADFYRLQRGPLAVYETTTNRRALFPVASDGEWTHIKEIGSTGAERYYKLGGYEGNYTISIYKEPSSAIEIIASYVSRNWMASGAGTVGYAFTAEDDVLIIPRRMIEAGIVWRWRERKGLPYIDKLNEYEILIARTKNDMRGRRVVNYGQPVIRRPWDVPVPDQIPTS